MQYTDDKREVKLRIEIRAGSTAMSSAKAVELAALLKSKLVGAQVDVAQDRPETQSLGVAILIAAGLPASLEALRIVEGYLMRDTTEIVLTEDGRTVFEGAPVARGQLARELRQKD